MGQGVLLTLRLLAVVMEVRAQDPGLLSTCQHFGNSVLGSSRSLLNPHLVGSPHAVKQPLLKSKATLTEHSIPQVARPGRHVRTGHALAVQASARFALIAPHFMDRQTAAVPILLSSAHKGIGGAK